MNDTLGVLLMAGIILAGVYLPMVISPLLDRLIGHNFIKSLSISEVAKPEISSEEELFAGVPPSQRPLFYYIKDREF